MHPYTRLFILPSAPTIDEDEASGYEAGDVVHVISGSVYDCRDATEGAAVWEERSSGSSFDGDITGLLKLSGDITPSALTDNTNNYDPSGLSTASVIRLSSNNDYDLTGLAGGADGRILALLNADSGSDSITLKDESNASDEANRFSLVSDIKLKAGDGVMLIYDATSTRWRALSTFRSDAFITSLINATHPSGSNTHSQIDTHIANTSNPHSVTAAQAGAATSGHTHAPTTGSAVLGSTFSITGAAGTYQGTGLSVSLPSAGTYLVTGNIRGRMIGNAGTLWWLHIKLRNTTDSSDITNSERLIVLTGTTGLHLQSTCPIHMEITVAGAKTIEVWAARNGAGTPSWTASTIESDGNGRSTLHYEKIG